MKTRKKLIIKISAILGLVLILIIAGVVRANQLKNTPHPDVAQAPQNNSSEPASNSTESSSQPPTEQNVLDAATTAPKTEQSKSSSSTASQAPTAKKTAPKPTVTTTKTPAPKATSNSPENQILALLNNERVANGLKPVVRNSLLDQAAYLKSKDMATNNYFAHTAPNGTTDFDIVKQVGYKYQAIGSNIAEGDFAGMEGLVQAWMDSPGHRKNILADFGQEIGIGIYGKYYTMMIAKPL